jgi:hypothetical protein
MRRFCGWSFGHSRAPGRLEEKRSKLLAKLFKEGGVNIRLNKQSTSTR